MKMFSHEYLICMCKCLFRKIYYLRKFLRLQYTIIKSKQITGDFNLRSYSYIYLPVRSYSYTYQSRLTRTITHIPREFTDCESIGLSSIVAPCEELELSSPAGYIEQGVRLQVLLLVNAKQHAQHYIVTQWPSTNIKRNSKN